MTTQEAKIQKLNQLYQNKVVSADQHLWLRIIKISASSNNPHGCIIEVEWEPSSNDSLFDYKRLNRIIISYFNLTIYYDIDNL